MAILRARHSPRCALRREGARVAGGTPDCTCSGGLLYYVVEGHDEWVYEEAPGEGVEEVEVSEPGGGENRSQLNIGFADWGDRWLESLERKPSTVGSYRSTIVHAKGMFGWRRVRTLGPEDIAGFNRLLREKGCSPSTRAKHLRVLSACLQAAVFYRYAESNPVRELPPAQRPRPERKEAAYFENAVPANLGGIGRGPAGVDAQVAAEGPAQFRQPL